MDARPTRNRLAAVVAVLAASAAAAGSLAAAPAIGEPAALPPDLMTLPIGPDQLLVIGEGKQTVLRLTTEITNRGPGPLEVFPSAGSNDCDGDGNFENDRDTWQRVFADTNGSGAFEPEADDALSERRFGCMRYHAAHGHWHVLDFARYELRREPSGKLVAASRKVGFCLADDRLVYPSPATPPAPHYPFGATSHLGCDQTATQGLSVGWADTYVFALPGQDLDITGLPRGHYCLVMRADPLDLLEETDHFGNDRRARLVLRPRKLSVRELDGGCRIQA